MKPIHHSKFIFLIAFSLATSLPVYASTTAGTIDPTNQGYYRAAFSHVPSTSGSEHINFGKFTSQSQYNITVTDAGLRGFAWGTDAGWIVMNCADTTSGCLTSNANFKVSVDASGTLSGYAWGEKTGWINFGPFAGNPNTPQVQINQSGQFAGVNSTSGYAWSQGYGWITFDCTSNATCVRTDYVPSQYRSGGTPPTNTTGGGSVVPPAPTNPVVSNPQPSTPPTTTPPVVTPPPTPVYKPGSKPTPSPVTPPQKPTPTPTPPTTTPEKPTPVPTTPTTTPPATTPNTTTPPSSAPQVQENTSSRPADNFSSGSTTPSLAASKPTTGGSSIILKSTSKVALLLATPVADVTAKTLSTVGIASGTGVATFLLASTFSFSDLFLIILRLWALLLEALGIKKRNRPWGTVYDSITKQPLDPAYVVLQDMQGNEITTCITDLDGRYGFLIPKDGTYKIIANKTNYIFPSKKLQGRLSDELYQELYSGEAITIAKETVITKNIPMDPLKFDWNEFAKRDQKLMKFYSKKDFWFVRVANALFAIGFIVSCIALINSPTRYNSITFVLYVVLYILTHVAIKTRPSGSIKEKTTGIPLSFAVIHVFSLATNTEILHKVADQAGVYYCLIPNGTYYIKIQKKNLDETYTDIYTSGSIEVTKGYINTQFEI